MALSRIVAQGTALVALRSYARSSPGSRKCRTLLAAILALGACLQCAFPQHTFFEEDCFNGKDDDRNGEVDCEDSACKQKVACLSSVPYWFGPVAVWRGSSNAIPPDCSSANYGSLGTTDVYFGGELRQSGDVSDCPLCTCAPGTPRCSSRLAVYDNCGGTEIVASFITTKCSAVQFPSGTPMSSTGYAVKAEPPVVADACVVQTPQSSPLPSPSSDQKVKFCNPATSGWGCGKETCVAYPSAPFGSALCVFAPGQLACPAGYPNPEYYYQAIDSRQCSPCSCTASGLSCPPDSPAVGDYGASSDCVSQRYAIPTNIACAKVPTPMTNPLNFELVNTSAQPVGSLYCAPSARTLTGSVTKGATVTLCCAVPPTSE